MAFWRTTSVLAIIFICFGFPLALYLTLRYYYSTKKLFKDPEIASMFGFCTQGFEPQFYYFESVYILRKVVYCLATRLPDFVSEDPMASARMESCTLIIVTIVFAILDNTFRPYDNRGYGALDKMETSASQAVVVTAILQTWVLLSQDTAVAQRDASWKHA
eukprot:TRINITY_DN21958_c0_g1_i1.p1 TRINITY_DN21958_c0_g1~~TRINITY_DN21958_c0_g1_i1.p1  ORF type:complete len:173 (+),score=18.98 TRINITY_DN21958_c0_g1_i1:39-521(+)